MSRLREKLRNFLGRPARLRRLEEEMRTHVELLVEEGISRGLPRDEALRRAHLAFGNVLATREETEEALGWPSVEALAHDVRIALRSLARRPAFAASLISILALGLGVTIAIFTFVRGMLWQPLPVPQPDQLYLASNVAEQHRPYRLGAGTVQRLETDPALAGRVIAYAANAQLALRRDDAPAEPVSGQFVSGGFFRGLQLAPAHGRLLEAADDEPDHPRPVAVASWNWWRKKLGSDPAAVGRTVRLNDHEVTIVGIAPEEFVGVSLGSTPDIWLPKGLHAALRVRPSASIIANDPGPELKDWVRDDRVSWLHVMVRVPGNPAAAQAALDAAWQPQQRRLMDEVDNAPEREHIGRERPLLEPSPRGYSSTRDGFRGAALTLMLLVGAMLCVTAANTSTLLLLRILGRGRELGVRLALGAGRWRLARAVLLEGVLLSVGGALAGLLLGSWLTAILAAWLAPGMPLPGLDPTLLLGLAALAVLLGLLLGALPAWFGARLSPQAILQQRATGGRGTLRLGRALIVVQLAVSVLMVAVAASLARDFQRAVQVDLGYARASVVTAFFDLRGAGIALEQDEAVTTRLREAALKLPQVRTVGFAASGALSGSRSMSTVYFRGDDVRLVHIAGLQHEYVDEGYFDAMGLTLLRGRVFTAADRDDRKPNVAIINQRLAQQVFGDADPIGRRYGFGVTADDEDWEIVGVVPDARLNGVRDEPAAMSFVPYRQVQVPPGCLVVRVEGDAATVRDLLPKAMAAAEPALMFSSWLTIEERVQRWMRKDLSAVRLTAGFSVLATLLAVIGVLGTLGYLVASRSREIAVRLAIGAEPSRIWRDLVRDALRLGLAGAGLGLALSFALLYGLGPKMMSGLRVDWLALAVAVAAGVLAAVVGGLLPARRAAKVDPLALLKAE
jgi:predicted permease